ncbi:esterase-like activity of phytase family protein [Modestobacter versicolor]|uniref:esterase-like activity of phytase family protein n=1 Tax=Modestobacter versicolor TaxID=429133 RepID=UPI0034DF77A8
MRRPRPLPLAGATALVGLLVGGLAVPALAGPPAPEPAGSGVQQAELVGRAVLPALTFGEEVPSGSLVADANGVDAPFAAQPVQGFSGLLPQGDGEALVLSDNGYGTKANSGDYLLRVNRLRIDPVGGEVAVVGGFGLSDPDHLLPQPLTRADRRLTGADLDPESFQQLPDGTFWFGEEFGPSLVHTDAEGRVLSAPVAPSGVRSPDAPDLAGGQPTIGSSKGFEGMALSPDGRTLYPMLEGAVAGDDPQTLRIYSFDTRKEEYTGIKAQFRLESPGDAIGDLVALDDHRFLVIERDNAQGPEARLKAVYLIDTRDRDRDGFADKQLLVNLLAIPDPAGIAGAPGSFLTFPFVTIEQLAVLDDHTIVVGNDNNFPGSAGRTAGVPDDNEYAVVRVDQDLDVRAPRR